MTLPINLTEGDKQWADDRNESANRGRRKKGPSVFAQELPSTRKLSDADVRKAGIQVARMAPEEAAELMAMLGISDHLLNRERISSDSTYPSFDRRRRA